LLNRIAASRCHIRLMRPLGTGIFKEKLASKKLCTDDDCVCKHHFPCRAEEDHDASDRRFINIKKLIYVYSKLMEELLVSNYTSPCLKVYGKQYEDHLGKVGYFPRSLVSEKHVYQEANKTVPTMVRNLQKP
ncbi:OTOR protein, partial [Climacteris rufus]|nr:OTOR protein [Climacteris rufus]